MVVIRAAAFLFVCGWTIIEVIIGLLQVFGRRLSNHPAFAITGSFENPGPYGGFIAIGMAIAAAYLIGQHKKCSNTRELPLRIVAVITLIAGTLVLPASMSRAGWFAFAAPTIAAVLLDGRMRSVLKSHKQLIAASGILLAIAGLASFWIKKDSAIGRFHIWHMEVLAIAQKPLFGHGRGHAMGAYGLTQADYFMTHPEVSESVIRVAGCPEYPFNEYLGVGMEYGLPAMLLVLLLTALVILSLYRNECPFWAGMLSLAIFSFASYPMSCKGFPYLLLTFLAFAWPAKRSRGAILYTMLFATTVIFLSFNFRSTRLEEKKARQGWERVSGLMRHEVLECDIELLDSLSAHLKEDHRFLYDYGYALHKLGRYAESTDILLQGAKISSDPMFHNIIGKNYENEGDFRAAEKEYILAHYMVPSRIYPLLLLSRMLIKEGRDSDAAVVLEKTITMDINGRNGNMKALHREALLLLDSLRSNCVTPPAHQ